MTGNQRLFPRHRTRTSKHKPVAKLPRCPNKNAKYWIESPNSSAELTNYLFKFPARFHPPVVRWALGKYGRRGSILIDPFTGSGTTQVEALARGISSVGIDIDPVACMMADVKTSPLNPRLLRDTLARMKRKLGPHMKAHESQEREPGSDIAQSELEREILGLWAPTIPNITHWFRRYVIVDLATLFWAIEDLNPGPKAERFFRACAGSIIRPVSNADPAPVSGLEVTSVQARKNKKRRIKVYEAFLRKTEQAITGMGQLWVTYRKQGNHARAWVLRGDALDLNRLLAKVGLPTANYPLVITSPPYCRSVEYSRRHRLEMYWLRFVKSQEEHVVLKNKYLGRGDVRESDWHEQELFGISKLDAAVKAIEKGDSRKARAVHHYFAHMREFFTCLRKIVSRRATVVVVIGDSLCCNVPVATATHVRMLAESHFKVANRFSYALRNHYMQYCLRNSKGIREEHVLTLKPR